MLKLIILDLDGVIFDTELNMLTSWNEVKKKYKLKKTFKEYRKHIGLPFQEILKNLKINKNKKSIQKFYSNRSIKNINKGLVKLLKKDGLNHISEAVCSFHKQ